MSWLSPTPYALHTALSLENDELVPRGTEGFTPTQPLFLSPSADRLLTRCHPLLPFALYLPCLVLLPSTNAAHSLSSLSHILHAALGWLAWTLGEYLLHRFALHLPGRSPAAHVARFFLHGHHHAAPGVPDRLVALPIQSASFLALLAGLCAPFVSSGGLHLLLSGSILGYLFYELVHFHAHHARDELRWLHALRTHHRRHHHATPSQRFGISTRLWDLVFRTLPTQGSSQ